tara:strand:+ start:474 stop:593 length:120 start_codon:yes stop_codon:yes gene_type:complete
MKTHKADTLAAPKSWNKRIINSGVRIILIKDNIFGIFIF